MKKLITDIQIDEKTSSRRILFLNGARFDSIDAGLISKFGLWVGLEIEADILRKLIQADEIVRAKNDATMYLKDENLSKEKLIDALKRKGFGEETIEAVLAELEQHGRIRDEKFAHAWVKRRQRSKPRSRKMMRRELRNKGIDQTTVDSALEAIDDTQEDQLALQAAQKQAKRYKSLEMHVAKRRLYAFLLRRGFGYETIQKTVESVLRNI